MRASWAEESESRWSSVWWFVRGSRFVDLPIRVVALVIGVTGFLPSSFEIASPPYLFLVVLANLLTIAAPFAPRSIGVSAVVLSGCFLWWFPEFVNRFPDLLIIVTAIMISNFRWLASGLCSLGVLLYWIVSTMIGTFDAGTLGLVDLGFGWVLACTLGMSAGLIETRIHKEISLRVSQRRAHDQKLNRLRLQFALDTHDTVSHSLATEAAMIKVLAREPGAPDAPRLIAELSLVNTHAHSRLRDLLTQLQMNEGGHHQVDLETLVHSVVKRAAATCAASGLNLRDSVPRSGVIRI